MVEKKKMIHAFDFMLTKCRVCCSDRNLYWLYRCEALRVSEWRPVYATSFVQPGVYHYQCNGLNVYIAVNDHTDPKGENCVLMVGYIVTVLGRCHRVGG